MDEKTREAAVTIFHRLGLSEDEAVELFYKRTIAAGRMPFAAADDGAKKRVKKTRMNTRFAEWDAF